MLHECPDIRPNGWGKKHNLEAGADHQEPLGQFRTDHVLHYELSHKYIDLSLMVCRHPAGIESVACLQHRVTTTLEVLAHLPSQELIGFDNQESIVAKYFLLGARQVNQESGSFLRGALYMDKASALFDNAVDG